MNGKLLGLVVALLVLVGLGWWFAGGGDQVAPQGAPAAPTPVAAKAQPAAAQGGAPAPEDPVAGNRSERSLVASGPVAGGPGAVLPQYAVHGRLLDKHGQPVAEAEVRLDAWQLDFDGVVDLPGRGPRTDAAPKVKTGTDGRFRFLVEAGKAGNVDLPIGKLVLKAGAVRFQKLAADVDLGDLAVLGAASLSGVVRDERQQPVADVKVRGDYSEVGLGAQWITTTDAEGRFRFEGLRGGKVHLRTASAKHLPQTLAVEVPPEQDKTDVVLVLQQGNAIAGQVVDDRGVPVAGIKVGAKRKEQHAGVSMERFTPDEATSTDANGWFVLAGLQGEAADVRAWGKGYAAISERGVPVPSGNLLLRVQRAATVEGVLKDSSGKPIAGSRVSASARALPGDGPMALAAVDLDLDLPIGIGGGAETGADGSFTLTDIEPGNLTVRARGQSHRPVERRGVVLQPGQRLTGIDLVADLGATVRVKVTDEAGKPVAGAKVTAGARPEPQGGSGMRVARRVAVGGHGGDVHVSNGQDSFGSATSDGDGIATIGGLPAGLLRLTGKHANLADAAPVDVTMPATGVVDAAMTLRQPGFALLRLLDQGGAPVTGEFVIHGPLGGDAAQDREGSYSGGDPARVGPLAAGDYQAEVRLQPKPQTFGGGGASIVFGGEGRGLAQTRVPFAVVAGQDAVVDLRKPILTRLHGKITGADGPVAGCMVELTAQRPEGEGGPGTMPGGAGATRSDGNGDFELAEIEAGDYELKWGLAGQQVKARAALTVPANLPELRKDLELRAGKLKVKAVDQASGEPIEGAEVELVEGASSAGPPRRERRVMMVSMSLINDGSGGNAETTTMSLGDQRAKTDVDGMAEIADVPPGLYTVRVSHDKHVTAELKDQAVQEKQTTDCGSVQLGQAGRIRGRVLAGDGRPAGMAMVECRAVGSSAEPKREPAMGGSFQFGGLAPGRYLLKAQAIGESEQPFGPELEVEVKAGKAPTPAELRIAQ